MATYDNKAWLLKSVRDAFIATDDTGLCEIVMAGEDFSKIFQNKAMEVKKRERDKVLYQPSTSKGKESGTDDEDDREFVTQFDPYPDMDDSDEDEPCPSYPRIPDEFLPVHRQKLTIDKKEQDLKKAARIKVIKWEDPQTQLTSEQLAEVFAKVEVKEPEKKKSLLAEQLENCPDLPHRQYLEYAKFDGTAQLGQPTKSFRIFMTMLPEKYQMYPVVVCVIASAKIKDLIGFTCYKYSIEHPDITLDSVHNYGLFIVEDDGEVDWAFPCLDKNEPCSKFGFTCLGLVDLKKRDTAVMACPMPDFDMNSAFQCFPKVSVSGQSNVNTSRLHTGDSDTTEVLRAMNTVIEGNKGFGLQSGAVADASQDKLYRVLLLHKVRANTPVQLGITLDTIEVVPLVPNKHAFWARPKYFLHSMNSIAWCQILEERSNKTTFRIVYSPNHDAAFSDRNAGNVNLYNPNTTYKKHDFEGEHEIAKKIVDNVNTILDLRNSPCRREYKTVKEKKLLQTRRSFHTKHLS
ncbi:stress-activated map kinase-interacting protein 1 [Maniola jurtina]|uniref:stress-activated map kinase-interacting protein 1 n=1 Tax=Maniola jurtina TaxID=191418 RepID=UPI001E6878FA|nr:stress-activated map kinase-interacting protein 1 [Maniola jurtina]